MLMKGILCILECFYWKIDSGPPSQILMSNIKPTQPSKVSPFRNNRDTDPFSDVLPEYHGMSASYVRRNLIRINGFVTEDIFTRHRVVF